MDHYEKRQLINRILSGYTFVGNYIIDVPSAKILFQGDVVYDKFMYDNRFESMLYQEKTEWVLIRHGLWSIEEKNQLDGIPKEIENTKLNLYKSAMTPSKQERFRSHLKHLYDQYNQLLIKKSLFDQYTIEAQAELCRERRIFSQIILDENYNKIELSPSQIDRVAAESKKQAISIKKYRELARSEEWQSIWSTNGAGAFRVIGEEQRYLIGFTQLYESVAKHPEAPPTNIINDDDMLDGWMIFMRKEHEQSKKEQSFTKVHEKGKGNEHFIMAQSKEDIDEIMGMNDARGRIIQKKLHAMTQRDGIANEYDLPEIRQDANIIKR